MDQIQHIFQASYQNGGFENVSLRGSACTVCKCDDRENSRESHFFVKSCNDVEFCYNSNLSGIVKLFGIICGATKNCLSIDVNLKNYALQYLDKHDTKASVNVPRHASTIISIESNLAKEREYGGQQLGVHGRTVNS